MAKQIIFTGNVVDIEPIHSTTYQTTRKSIKIYFQTDLNYKVKFTEFPTPNNEQIDKKINKAYDDYSKYINQIINFRNYKKTNWIYNEGSIENINHVIDNMIVNCFSDPNHAMKRENFDVFVYQTFLRQNIIDDRKISISTLNNKIQNDKSIISSYLPDSIIRSRQLSEFKHNDIKYVAKKI